MRPGAGRAGVAALTLAALVMTACAPAADEPAPSAEPTYSAPPPTPVAVTPVPAPTQAVDPGMDVSGWQVFQTPTGATFRVPPGWTVQDLGAADGWTTNVAVFRGDGEQQLVYLDGSGPLDGACPIDASGEQIALETEVFEALSLPLPVAIDPASTFSDAQQQAAYGAFAHVRPEGGLIFSMGITQFGSAEAPVCPHRNAIRNATLGTVVFGSEPVALGLGAGSVWVVSSMDAARAYLQTDEYRTIRAILLTLQLPSA